jgi:hypothetical protein
MIKRKANNSLPELPIQGVEGRGREGSGGERTKSKTYYYVTRINSYCFLNYMTDHIS